MRSPIDLAHGWLRKADSDLDAARKLNESSIALDAACFHAQQAAEKALKAYLAARMVAFPFTHNLAKLVLACQECDPAFEGLGPVADPLTPYAVALRYDDGFWPTSEEVLEAIAAAEAVRAFVDARIPLQP